MLALNEMAQFYAVSWLATVGLLSALLAFYLVRDARRQARQSTAHLDGRFRRSLLSVLLARMGVRPERYLQAVRSDGLALQIMTCESCRFRVQCAERISTEQPPLSRCPNAKAIARYFSARSCAA